jgi:selenide,water dikinase
VSRFTDFGDASPEDSLVLADAQTSGGLLMAVAPDRLADMVTALLRERTPTAAVIGTVTGRSPGGRIVVTP